MLGVDLSGVIWPSTKTHRVVWASIELSMWVHAMRLGKHSSMTYIIGKVFQQDKLWNFH